MRDQPSLLRWMWKAVLWNRYPLKMSLLRTSRWKRPNQSAPSKKPRTPAHPPAASVKRERGSNGSGIFEDLGGEDRDVFRNLPKISDEDVQEAMKQQGVWGKQSTHVDPQNIDMARTFSSAPDASKASEIKDEFVTTTKRDLRSLISRTLTSTRPSWQRTRPLSAPGKPEAWTSDWLLPR